MCVYCYAYALSPFSKMLKFGIGCATSSPPIFMLKEDIFMKVGVEYPIFAHTHNAANAGRRGRARI